MNECKVCGADREFASREDAKKAGWFSRRHKTEHGLEDYRATRDEHATLKRARVAHQEAARAVKAEAVAKACRLDRPR